MSEHRRQHQLSVSSSSRASRFRGCFLCCADNELEPEIQHASAALSISDCLSVSLSVYALATYESRDTNAFKEKKVSECLDLCYS